VELSCDRGFSQPAAAQFDNPAGLAISPPGDAIIVCDRGNNCVRRIDIATGAVVTIAGGGPDSCGDTDGPSKDATICRPVGAAYDRNGDLLVGATVIWHPASADEILNAVFVMAACHGAYTPESGDCGHTIRRLTADGPGPPGAVKCP
jgi:hypothetical protein